MTVKHADDYSIRRTYVRRIPALALNFRTISDLSSLSWEAYDHDLPLDELKKRYAVITTQPRMSRWVVLILVAFANAAFCRLFGGDWIAMGLVWMATLTGFFVRQELTVRKVNHMLIFMFVHLWLLWLRRSVCILMGYHSGCRFRYECTFFNPGVPLINSILDILEGHVLIGFSRAINAAILIICIALGCR